MTTGVLLEPLTQSEFDAWAEHSRRGFAAQQVAAGLQPEADALEAAERGFAELLPDGLATPQHHVLRVTGPAGGTVGSARIFQVPSFGNPGNSSGQPSQPATISATAERNAPFAGR